MKKKNKENQPETENGMKLEVSMGGITGKKNGGGELSTKASSFT
jgi:hypothetical protein